MRGTIQGEANMSRMILLFAFLTFASGCTLCSQTFHSLSVIDARLVTLGPDWRARRTSGDCCDSCVPCRPWTCGYYPWMDYHGTEHTAQKCAFRALHQYKQSCGRPVSHHFKNGFISAYEDLALNRRPSPPVVPPPLYWNAYYRSCAGQGHVDEWYAGYQAGLSMGSESGVSRFREIALFNYGYTDADFRGGDGAGMVGQETEPDYPQEEIAPIPAAANRTQFNPYGGRY